MGEQNDSSTRPRFAVLRQRVSALRRKYPHLPIAAAVRSARAELAPQVPQYPFLAGFTEGESLTGDVEGFTVSVRTEIDTDTRPGDDDVTGWFTDRYEAGCVPNTVTKDGHGYKWYRPSNATLQDTLAEFRRTGMSKSAALDAYRDSVQREMRDDATRYYIGVIATVTLNGHPLSDSSLWAIDMSPDDDPSAYLIEVAEECIWEALDQAKSKPRPYLEHVRACTPQPPTPTKPQQPAPTRGSEPTVTPPSRW